MSRYSNGTLSVFTIRSEESREDTVYQYTSTGDMPRTVTRDWIEVSLRGRGKYASAAEGSVDSELRQSIVRVKGVFDIREEALDFITLVKLLLVVIRMRLLPGV